MSNERSISDQTALLEAFIGPRSAYYLPVFYAQALNGRSIGWNWPAFFLGPIWFGYRRMYFWAAAYIVVDFLTSVVSYLVATNEADIAIAVFGFGLMVVSGLYANALYRGYCVNQLSLVDDNAKLRANRVVEIDRRGGVSMAAGWLCAFLVIAAFTPDVIRGYQEGLEETERDGYGNSQG